jgi:DNA polymerase III subunit gamma/tau
MARTKVYIIDEVHMLSKQAFNGLLKTLEEPPNHVKFVFATTEIEKVPVTVRSRCQRFDLRRVDTGVRTGYLASICAKEAVAIEDEALSLVARAAEGSVRDALLLDQPSPMARVCRPIPRTRCARCWGSPTGAGSSIFRSPHARPDGGGPRHRRAR